VRHVIAGLVLASLSVLSLVVPAAAAAAAPPTVTGDQRRPSPPPSTATSVAPAPAPSPAGCTALLFNGQWYCNASISHVKATRFGLGARVVLRDVSVTSVMKCTVTVKALEWGTCPTGSFCGDLSTVQTLTVSWTARNPPSLRQVINLYGTTITGSVSPVGYVKTNACYIDYC
jgi:hypothetical protein